MRLLQDLLDRSKQLNQAPYVFKNKEQQMYLPFHAPNQQYRIIHIAIKIPNLPVPLHYLNFFSIVGLPKATAFYNENSINTNALDTATVLSSISPHMVGQLHSYSIQHDCEFNHQTFQFSDNENLSGDLSAVTLQRVNDELSFNLKVETLEPLAYFYKLRFKLAEYWSLPAICKGQIVYQQKTYEIADLASFEFARSKNLPYIPFAFYVYQLINLNQHTQIIFVQYRNAFNQLISSRIYLREINGEVKVFDQHVEFSIQRIYPAVKTPNGQIMYLPREFNWGYHHENDSIQLVGSSRGDFKFGLGAGFVGSFYYTLYINDQVYEGVSGYCEYIDCRALRWQEQNEEEKVTKKRVQTVPLMLKNNQK
jgi:hypothetical protein